MTQSGRVDMSVLLHASAMYNTYCNAISKQVNLKKFNQLHTCKTFLLFCLALANK